MNHLIVPLVNDAGSLAAISLLLDKQQRHHLLHAPWKEFPYRPEAGFSIAHTRDSILLKFYVTENNIRSVNQLTNSPVYEDSCVEWFIRFPGSQAYYNLEVNCTATVLMANGTGRANRTFLPDEKIASIKRMTSIAKAGKINEISWELTAVLPLSLFEIDPANNLRGLQCEGNFYKCGDLLPEPHFICWSPVITDTPDFHQPDYFGKIIFE